VGTGVVTGNNYSWLNPSTADLSYISSNSNANAFPGWPQLSLAAVSSDWEISVGHTTTEIPSWDGFTAGHAYTGMSLAPF
jgi:hypothetical protein